MDSQDLLSKFENLLAAIRSLVDETKHQMGGAPDTRLLARWQTDEAAEVETGVHQRHAHLEYIEKSDWAKPAKSVLDRLKDNPAFLEFRETLNSSEGNDVVEVLERAASTLIAKCFEAQEVDAREALDHLLCWIRRKPVPVWSEIDVHGITLRVKSITLDFTSRRLVFRQLRIADYEHEFNPGVGDPSRERFVPPPGCILKIELAGARSLDLQIERRKALAVLRLAHVCSVDFAQETHGTASLFSYSGGMYIGGTIRSGRVCHGQHETVLTEESEEKLKRFWARVENVLPAELYELSNKNETALTIAYERYCDGLLAHGPIERKVAAAIMGLEALYFQREELQELAYRLSLRVSKVMSKLNLSPGEIQRQVKAGYRIRSLHVHGSHLSTKEQKEIQKTVATPKELAAKLLDYLRISILHLVIARQAKAQFLELIEESLVNREKDDALDVALKTEAEFLCIRFP